MKRRGKRRWSLEQHGIRREGSKEDGFRYVSPDGAEIAAETTLARIRGLRIPPAWVEVRIAGSDRADLQAIGVDAAGRTQYLYHTRFRQKRDQEKFLRVVNFGESLPRLRARVAADLRQPGLGKETVTAAVVRILDQGYLRIGNARSARDRETFGLTTIRSEHVRISGDRVTFQYVGKSNKPQLHVIEDKAVARVIQRLRRARGEGLELFGWVEDGRVFPLKDRHVNEYIQNAIGTDFTAKDFRTWGGTLVCSMALAEMGQAATKTERKRRSRRAVESTAEALGNTPTVCRTSYICPRLLDDYQEGHAVDSLHKPRARGVAVPRAGLSPEEKGLLRFFRETIADRRKRRRKAAA